MGACVLSELSEPKARLHQCFLECGQLGRGIEAVFSGNLDQYSPQHFTNQQHLIPSTNDDEYGIAQIDSTGKRLGAALIAIPLGMLGMHRIYLGTQPIVPIFYILTFGGGFGILPFIDFVVLIMADDMKPYINNPRIFMWSNQKPATLP